VKHLRCSGKYHNDVVDLLLWDNCKVCGTFVLTDTVLCTVPVLQQEPSEADSQTSPWSTSTRSRCRTCADIRRRNRRPEWSVGSRDCHVGLWCDLWTGPKTAPHSNTGSTWASAVHTTHWCCWLPVLVSHQLITSNYKTHTSTFVDFTLQHVQQTYQYNKERITCQILHSFNGQIHSRTTWLSWYQNVKPCWVLLRQDTMEVAAETSGTLKLSKLTNSQ